MRFSLRVLTLACSVSALAVFASAQSRLHAASQPWSRTFGGALPGERVLDLRQASDGSLRVAGRSDAFGTGTSAGWLLALSLAEGDVRFERAIAPASPFPGGAEGAGLANDGGALFTGRDVIDLFHKHDAWAARVNAAGNVQWSKRFTLDGAVGRFFLMDAAELANGSWIAAGATSSIDEPPQKAWLVKLGPTGAVEWQFAYAGGEAEWIASVVPTSDGGYALAGSTSSSGAGSDDAYVLKLDAAGAIEWQCTFGGSDAEQATEIVELGSGGYAVAAWTNSFTPSGHAPWVLRLDASGQLVWHAVIGSDVWGDLDAIAESQDGQVIAFGRVGEPGFPTNDLWAAKLAATNGAVAWQRAYEGDLGDWGSQVLTLSGGGLLFGGEWGSGFAEEDLWLLRTDAFGRTGCEIERKTLFATSSPNLVAQPGIAVREPGSALVQTMELAPLPTRALVEERCASD